MVLVTEAIRDDIASQPEAFRQLRDSAPEQLSEVRLLDILAWRCQGKTPTAQVDQEPVG